MTNNLIYLDCNHTALQGDGTASSPFKDAGDKVRLLSFYLSMEEFAARYLPSADYFFMWQVEPSVIFGRNQVIENEVNIPYCRKHNIKMYRRKSGGGCVYADMSNVMLSYITPEDNVSETFTRYLSMVSETLQNLGLDAHPSGNNDIMLREKDSQAAEKPERKVSGNAIYHLPGRIIAHGTLLYDTDMENMLHAITPSHSKLSKHGVESVRQRICLLKDYTSLPLSEIKTRIRSHLCGDNVYHLTSEDIAKVKEIEKEYLEHDFIFCH